MPGLHRKIRKIDAQLLHRRRELFLEGQVKQDMRIGRHGQPGVLRQFMFKLPLPQPE